MWRTLFATTLLCTLIQAAVFTEGGSVGSDFGQKDYETAQNDYLTKEQMLQMEDELRQLAEAEEEAENNNREARQAEEYQREMTEVLEELARDRQRNEQSDYADDVEIDIQRKEKDVAKESEVKVPAPPAKEASVTEAKETEQPVDEVIASKPMVAQKKGQNEFVSFVEPVEAKQTKSLPNVDKRRLVTQAEASGNVPKYSSNLLLIAVGTVLMVGTVGAVVGGGVYLKRRRELPDDGEYAPYAGTGPGFKKSNKSDKGDESLAYKAQLHHYQQAKQKIICGDDAPGVMESDGEEEGADDENNFSVYECPGLAPTGDIEVCNPNFAVQP